MDEEVNTLLQPRQRIVNILNHFATIGSILTILIGIVCLAGWQFDIVFLKKIFLLTAIMNPLSAVGFICSGFSLLILQLSERKNALPPSILFSVQLLFSIITVLIGFIMLL